MRERSGDDCVGDGGTNKFAGAGGDRVGSTSGINASGIECSVGGGDVAGTIEGNTGSGRGDTGDGPDDPGEAAGHLSLIF